MHDSFDCLLHIEYVAIERTTIQCTIHLISLCHNATASLWLSEQGAGIEDISMRTLRRLCDPPTGKSKHALRLNSYSPAGHMHEGFTINIL